MWLLLRHIAQRVEVFSSKKPQLVLIGALTSGLCLSAVVCITRSMSGSPVSLRIALTTALLSIAAYVASALLLQRYWTELLKRMLPIWMMTALLGSFLLVIIISIPKAIAEWRSPLRVEQTIGEFIFLRLEDAQAALIVFSIISFTISGLYYYAGDLIKVIRRWHDRAVEPPSILPTKRLNK